MNTALRRALLKLPEQTSLWTCRWFTAILLVGIPVLALAIIHDIDGGMVTTSLLLGYLIGMRTRRDKREVRTR